MPVSNNASAIFTIDPASNLITNSTYTASSFTITNNSDDGQKINKVVIDLSSAIFKDLVFDPDGTAGDLVGKSFTVNEAGNTGQTSFNYISAHDGGYFGLEISFDDFQPNETFKFSLDIDPTSLKGTQAPGPEKAGNISGLELVGSTITIDFDDNTSATGQPYYVSGTNDASTTVIQAELPAAPTLEILGVASETITGTSEQTVRITGTPGADVSLLTTEGALFLQEGTTGFDIDAFEANSAVAINEQAATIGNEGYVDISVALTRTDVDSGEAGLNILTAVTKDENGVTSLISNVAVVEYDPAFTSLPTAIRINAGGAEFTDAQGNVWSGDQYFTGGNVFAKDSAITGTEDDSLYNTERFLNGNGLSYDIPIENGEYQVTLKFAEIFFGDSGKRVFDATAEGQTVVNNLDIVAQAGGKNVALDKTFNVTVTDGVLDLDFASEIENAKISAIEVIPAGEVVDPVDPVDPPVDPVDPPVDPVDPPVDPVDPPVDPVDPPVDPQLPTTVRINAGGAEFTDAQGNVWSDDQYFTGGNVFTKDSAITGTEDDSLYNTERFLNGNGLSYDIPIENGEYQVTLKFAEIFFGDSGKRVFDATAEGQTVVNDLDIVAQAGGKNVALDKTFNVTVTDGVLDLDFASEIENAKISAIEVIPAGEVVDPVDPVDPPVDPVDPPVDPVDPPVDPVDPPVDPQLPTTVRINAGGAEFTDAQGNVWSDDQYFTGGNVFAKDSAITGTEDDSLYNTERFLNGNGLSYDIPIENGEYQVTLKFAEIFFGDSGKRVFDATAEGQTVVNDLDIVAQAGGKNVALDKTFNVTVTDGVLDLDFASEIENAKISAIEVVPAGEVVDPVDPPVDPPVNPPSESETIRINAGGGDYIDPSENLWIGDQYFNGGNTSSTADPIVSTDLDPIYQSERWAQNLVYDIPVSNGLYAVNLHFAEIYFNAPGERKFDVSLEGEQVIDGLDIYASTKNAFDPGHDKAYVAKLSPIQVEDGILDLNLNASINNAKISGIEIVPLEGSQVILQQSQASTVVKENGNGDTYTLTLTEQPSSDVIVNIDSNDLLDTNKSQVIFTPENWSVSQTVVVNAPNNNQASGTKFTSISHSVVSADSDYNNYELGDLSVRIEDDDTVAVKFNQKTIATDIDPSPYTGATVGTWGPDGRLYVGSYTGVIKAFTFDDNYNVTNTETIDTLVGQSNPNILGISFNPFDSSDNPQIYVSHSQLYANNNGKGFPTTEFSPYSGQVSILSGNNFDNQQALITGLPVSNHDHGVNDLVFDNQGDLLIAVGGNTNAGITNDKIGGIPESPLSAAVLKAEISKPDFNGDIQYNLVTDIDPDNYDDLPGNFNPDTDFGFDPAQSQVFGDLVEVAPGSDVSVYASGLRNTFSLVLTTDDLIYGVENGANGGFGDVSTSATTQEPFPANRHSDELNLLEENGYYGFANRSRGITDDRQNVYYGPDEASQNGYTAPTATFNRGSTNGLDEYRSNSFGGQLKGDILTQKINYKVEFISLNENGTQVESKQELNNVADALDIFTGPRGAVVGVDFFEDRITVALPDDASIGDDPTALDIFPWRAPATGGNTFVVGGDNFGDINNTSVTIGGEVAQISSVSDGLIYGTLPAFANPSGELLDVVVQSAGQTSVLDDAFLALA